MFCWSSVLDVSVLIPSPVGRPMRRPSLGSNLNVKRDEDI